MRVGFESSSSLRCWLICGTGSCGEEGPRERGGAEGCERATTSSTADRILTPRRADRSCYLIPRGRFSPRHPTSRTKFGPPASTRNATTSSNGSSTGGRLPPLRIERAHLPTGRTREYIVLGDSPTPPPKKRTRAVVDAVTTGGASQVASGSGASSAGAAPKKRRVGEQTVGGSGERMAGPIDDQRVSRSTQEGTACARSRADPSHPSVRSTATCRF